MNTCPYCGKRPHDMQHHLTHSKACKAQHIEHLREEIRRIIEQPKVGG